MSGIVFPTPDETILSRRAEIIAGLAKLVPSECLVTSEDERRAFETDGLMAYRRLPLAVVLPRSTEEVSAVMRYLHQEGVKVVARGAGTSLAGGAIPLEDSVVIGVGKMRKILDVDYAEPDDPRRDRLHQSLDHRCGGGRRLLLCAGPVLAARLHHRRQYRDEFRRRALPEIWRHHQ